MDVVVLVKNGFQYWNTRFNTLFEYKYNLIFVGAEIESKELSLRNYILGEKVSVL